MAEKDQTPAIFDAILDGAPEPSEFAEAIAATDPAPLENPANAPSVPLPENAPVISSNPAEATGDNGQSSNPPTNSDAGNDDVFNPDIHVGGPDGRGVRTSKGKFRRKPGRKPGGSYSHTSPNPQTVDVNAVDPVRMERAKSDAQIATSLALTLGVVILGEDGKPIVDPEKHINEPAEFIAAFTQYFYMKGPLDISPGWILAITLFQYSARRATLPTVRQRLGSAFGWFKTNVLTWIGFA